MSGAGGTDEVREVMRRDKISAKHSQALKVITRVFSGEAEHHCSF